MSRSGGEPGHRVVDLGGLRGDLGVAVGAGARDLVEMGVAAERRGAALGSAVVVQDVAERPREVGELIAGRAAVAAVRGPAGRSPA